MIEYHNISGEVWCLNVTGVGTCQDVNLVANLWTEFISMNQFHSWTYNSAFRNFVKHLKCSWRCQNGNKWLKKNGRQDRHQHSLCYRQACKWGLQHTIEYTKQIQPEDQTGRAYTHSHHPYTNDLVKICINCVEYLPVLWFWYELNM